MARLLARRTPTSEPVGHHLPPFAHRNLGIDLTISIASGAQDDIGSGSYGSDIDYGVMFRSTHHGLYFSYTLLCGTIPISPGSPPVPSSTIDNSVAAALQDYAYYVESAIWEYNPVTQAITAQYINTDGSQPQTYFVFGSIRGSRESMVTTLTFVKSYAHFLMFMAFPAFLGVTGDPAAFLQLANMVDPPSSFQPVVGYYQYQHCSCSVTDSDGNDSLQTFTCVPTIAS